MKKLICFLIGHKLLYLMKVREPIDISSALCIYQDIVECIFCKRCGYRIFGK